MDTRFPPFNSHDVLPPNVCRQLIGMAVPMQAGRTIAGDSDGARRCEVHYSSPGKPVYNEVAYRLWEHRSRFNDGYGFLMYSDIEKAMPSVTVCRYGVGQRYTMHQDQCGDDDTINRKLTVVIQLNDPAEYKGGELVVFDGQLHRPLAGSFVGRGVSFPSYLPHAVKTITYGVRYSLVVWLLGPPYR